MCVDTDAKRNSKSEKIHIAPAIRYAARADDSQVVDCRIVKAQDVENPRAEVLAGSAEN